MTHVRYLMIWFATALVVVLVPTTVISFPSVYPTGTTIYQPDKTWSGYTLFDARDGNGAVLIDMNGTELRRWDTFLGNPLRIFPGGYIMGGVGRRDPHQESGRRRGLRCCESAANSSEQHG